MSAATPTDADRDRGEPRAGRRKVAGDGHGGGYRRDVQGLRAIAVLTVVADHASLGPLTGGFVGVDVFFVVSGFLITQLLVAEVARSGRLSLLGFYARRARRILPAATLVLVVTAIVSALVLGPFRTPGALVDIVWAAFFLANVRFAQQGTDYFARDLPPSPVQHYWSLAVEEQFYLVWPLLLLVVVLLARAAVRRRAGAASSSTDGAAGTEAPTDEAHRPPYLAVVAVLVVLGGASLVWSIARTGSDPTSAYFSGFTRAWELAVGALAAVLVAARGSVRARRRAEVPTSRVWLSDGVTLAGLVAIGVACLAYDDSTPFPGSAALLPVLGTAAVLTAGAHGLEQRTWTGRLLGVLPLRKVGDWSYSVYLWHWPLLILAAAYAGGPLTVWERVGIVVFTLLLSALTYRYVENPVRRSPRLARAWRGIVLYPLSLVLVVAGSASGHAYLEWSQNRGDNPALELGSRWQQRFDTDDSAVGLVRASIEAARDGAAIPSDLRPELTEVGDSVGDLGDCDYADDSIRTLCPRGDVDADRTIVVYGNSHARHWVDAFDQIGQALGYKTYYLAKIQCLASLVTPDEQGGGPFEGCGEFHTWAMEQIADLHPDLVVVSSSGTRGGVYDDSGTHYTGDDSLPVIQQGYVDLFDQLVPNADRTVLLQDIPFAEPDPSECIAGRDATLESCLAKPMPQATAAGDRQTEAAESVSGVEVVPTKQWFCWQGVCPAVVGDLLPYRDGEHMTNPYSAHLADSLAKALDLTAAP